MTPPDAPFTVGDLSPAGRGVLAAWTAPVVLNRWLVAAVGLAVAVVAGLTVAQVRMADHLAHLKPIVVRIDAVGRAEAVTYDAATWKPQPAELRYFLTRFVDLHYTRLRATVARDYSASLMFLAQPVTAREVASAEVEHFLQDPAANEVEIDVTNVTFIDLSTPPYRASVDYVARQFSAGSATPRATTTYTAQVAFQLRDSVPSAYIPVNPLGFEITRLSVDQGF